MASRTSPSVRKPRSTIRSSSSSTSLLRETLSGRFCGSRPTSSSVAAILGRKLSRRRLSAASVAAPSTSASCRRCRSEIRTRESRRWALRRCRDTSTRRWLGSSRRIGRRPQRQDPVHDVDRRDRPPLIDADLLQVVKQPGLDRPQSPRRLMGQGQQGLAPGPRLLVFDAQGRLQPIDQSVHFVPQGGRCLRGPLARGPELGPGAANGGPRQIAAGGLPRGPLATRAGTSSPIDAGRGPSGRRCPRDAASSRMIGDHAQRIGVKGLRRLACRLAQFLRLGRAGQAGRLQDFFRVDVLGDDRIDLFQRLQAPERNWPSGRAGSSECPGKRRQTRCRPTGRRRAAAGIALAAARCGSRRIPGCPTPPPASRLPRRRSVAASVRRSNSSCTRAWKSNSQ